MYRYQSMRPKYSWTRRPRSLAVSETSPRHTELPLGARGGRSRSCIGRSALSSEVGSWYAWWSTAMQTEAVWTE